MEVDGGAWAAVGSEIVRIPASGEPVVIMKAMRVHGALAEDEDFVYFATP